VVRDLGGVVDVVCDRVQGRRVAIVGWATGGMWAGHYASLYPERVSHLVFYNALYGGHDGHPLLGRGSPGEDPNRPGRFNIESVKSYQFHTAGSLTPSWDNSIPGPDPAGWRNPQVLDTLRAPRPACGRALPVCLRSAVVPGRLIRRAGEP
jgi:pimeloyl-ACP methyl ester carboxylesterase